MSKRIGFIGSLILALALSAPVQAASSDEYANIHTVGIISALGGPIALTDIGVTVFGNQQNELPIDNWGLDDFVARDIAQAVSGRFVVKKVSADATQIESLNPAFLDAGDPDLKKFVLSLPATNNVDAYIVATKLLENDSIGQTNQHLWGLGFYHHELFFGQSVNAVYAFYRVVVIDAHTGAEIDYGTAHLTEGSFFGDPLPMQSMPAEDWAETAAALAPEQTAHIKSAMIGIVRGSLPGALKKANLIASGTGSSAASPTQ